MAEQYDINQPIYQVGEANMSFSKCSTTLSIPLTNEGICPEYRICTSKTGRPVSFRIDDDLTPIPEGVGVNEEVLKYMLGILLSEKHLKTVLDEDDPQGVDTAFEWKDQGVNFRLNVFRDRDGMAFVMRVLASNIPSIQEVGLPSEKIWQDITSLKRGLVLVTGVTGSGKSTTISALVNHINLYRKTRIITLKIRLSFFSKARLQWFPSAKLVRA